MKKLYLGTLLALVGFAGLAGIAKADASREISVTLPFEFVANGKTLPAGVYTVTRVSEDTHSALLLINRESHVSVFVQPVTVEDARDDKPTVSFAQVGESHFLSKIETADRVYTLSVSRSAK